MLWFDVTIMFHVLRNFHFLGSSTRLFKLSVNGNDINKALFLFVKFQGESRNIMQNTAKMIKK